MNIDIATRSCDVSRTTRDTKGDWKPNFPISVFWKVPTARKTTAFSVTLNRVKTFLRTVLGSESKQNARHRGCSEGVFWHAAKGHWLVKLEPFSPDKTHIFRYHGVRHATRHGVKTHDLIVKIFPHRMFATGVLLPCEYRQGQRVT